MNETIVNNKSGQEISFIHQEEKLLIMRSVYAPNSKRPVAHYHPHQTEIFTVISGKLNIILNNKLHQLVQGQRLYIPAKASHTMWNDSNEDTIVEWKVTPALRTLNFLQTVTALSNKYNSDKPPFLLTMLLVKEYANEFRIAGLPFILQKILFCIFCPIAKWKGYNLNEAL